MSSSSISLGRPGLDGLDDYLDNLQDLFEQLQLCSIDAANFEDVLTFAGRAVYFAIINKTTTTIIKPEEDTKEDTQPKPPPPPTQTRPSRKQRKRNKGNERQNGQNTGQNTSAKENTHSSTKSESSTTESTPGSSHGGKPQKKPRPTSDIIVHETTKIGFVYLMEAPNMQQTNVGVIIKPEERGWGFARDALSELLPIAFEQFHCHRVQAQVMDGPWKLDTLKAFTKLSFAHEGTRRQSIYSPFWCGWKDVTTLAMLDTDWITRENRSMVAARRAELTLWDDMFERHEKERQALLKGKWVV